MELSLIMTEFLKKTNFLSFQEPVRQLIIGLKHNLLLYFPAGEKHQIVNISVGDRLYSL